MTGEHVGLRCRLCRSGFGAGLLRGRLSFFEFKADPIAFELEKGRKWLALFRNETGDEIGFPVSISLTTCSRVISRWQMVLPMRNLHFPVLLHW